MTKENSMVMLIIYLAGVVAAYILSIGCAIKNRKELRFSDIMFAFVHAGFSWLYFVIGLCIEYGDVVVYKQKPKNNVRLKGQRCW